MGIFLDSHGQGHHIVADFTRSAKHLEARSLDEFMNSAPDLFRRDYHGNEIDPVQTVALAMELIHGKFEIKYHIKLNNCETVATKLKLWVASSKQVEDVKLTQMNLAMLLTGAPKLLSVGEIVETSVNIAANASRAAVAGKGIANVARVLPLVSVIAGAVGTVLDAGFLAWDWASEPVQISWIRAYQTYLVSVMEKLNLYG